MSSFSRPVWAAVFLDEEIDGWDASIASLRASAPEVKISIGARPGASFGGLEGLADETLHCPSAVEHLAHLFALHGAHLLVLLAPTLFPGDLFNRTAATIDGDLRCASVSFLSARDPFSSFAVLDENSRTLLGRITAQEGTDRLRSLATGLDLVPTAVPLGPAILLTAQGLSLIGIPTEHGHKLALSLADYGGAGRRRGMLDLIDPATVIELAGEAPSRALTDPDRAWLDARYTGLASSLVDPAERFNSLNEVLALVRSTLVGLRVLVDGTCLMPEEMGHQVTFLAQLDALAARDDIEYLGVVLHSPPPRYAEAVLSNPKIDARVTDLATLKGFEEVDVMYRPFQVTAGLDLSGWRSVARRSVVAIHDLISYQISSYHGTKDNWITHRQSTRRSTTQVDGIVVISEDVHQQVLRERLGVDPDRIFLAPNGVGHLTGSEPAVQPAVLREQGFAAERFVLVLGTDYTHKNRERAIEVLAELRRRGSDLCLVMAGAHVGAGSSREAEAALAAEAKGLYVIPDVSSEERNWLLRHASVVLYPTAAEGFGLVPHEAAAFGTPTALVPIPALAERLSGLPVLAQDFSASALADACELLAADPDLSARQIKLTNAHLDEYNWDQNVDLLLNAFHSLMARPPVATL